MTGGRQSPSATPRRARMSVPHEDMPARCASRPRIHEACHPGPTALLPRPVQARTATTPLVLAESVISPAVRRSERESGNTRERPMNG